MSNDTDNKIEKTLRETTKNDKIKLKLKAVVGETWQRYLSRRSEQDSVFGPWKIYSNVSTNHLGIWYAKDGMKLQEAYKKVVSMIPNADPKAKKKGKQLNPYVASMFRTRPQNMQDVAARYRTILAAPIKPWLDTNRMCRPQWEKAKAEGRHGHRQVEGKPVVAALGVRGEIAGAVAIDQIGGVIGGGFAAKAEPPGARPLAIDKAQLAGKFARRPVVQLCEYILVGRQVVGPDGGGRGVDEDAD